MSVIVKIQNLLLLSSSVGRLRDLTFTERRSSLQRLPTDSFTVVIYPVWESRQGLGEILAGLANDIRGRRPRGPKA